MDAESAVEKAIAFLEPTRSAIDAAEMAIVGSMNHPDPATSFRRGLASLNVAMRNLDWCRASITEVACTLLSEYENATAVDGAAAGSTLPAGQKTGGNRVP